MPSFFPNASNILISGGTFNNVNENCKLFDHSRHTSNTTSLSSNKVLNSHSDNSIAIIRDGSDEENVQMSLIPSKAADHREEDHTVAPPPPQYSHLYPQQITSAGDTVTNLDSYNVHINSCNNSENYYRGRAPPNQKGQNNEPEWQEMDRTLQRQAGIGGPSGPHMPVNSAHIQSMVQRNFKKLLKKFTLFQTQSTEAGNDGAQYNPEVVYSSSSNIEGNNSMNTGMANLYLNDLLSPVASTHPQITTNLSPPTTFSRTKSDPQISLKLTTPDQTGSSNPSTGNLIPYSKAQGSHSNPSLAPHMNEPAMVNLFSLPAETQDNPSRRPLLFRSPFNFPSSSSDEPNFGPLRMLGPDQEMDHEGLRSTSGSHGSGQFVQSPLIIGIPEIPPDPLCHEIPLYPLTYFGHIPEVAPNPVVHDIDLFSVEHLTGGIPDTTESGAQIDLELNTQDSDAV